MKPRIDQYERAGRAWPILAECARKRKTITYGQLASELNLHPRVCRFFLGKIQEYNLKHELLPLQSLAVYKASGKPGKGYIATPINNIKATHEEVFNFDWNKIRNPFGS